MKRFRILFLLVIACSLLLTLCSCSTPTRVVTASHPMHDTVFVNHTMYDSIYIDNWYVVDHTADTVHILERQIEHRYTLLHDTTYISRTDTIPIVTEVEVVREVPRGRNWLDTLSLCCLGIVLFGFLILLLCLIKGLRSL